MKKRYIASIGAAGASVAAGLWLKNKQKKSEKSTLEQAGVPDQMEHNSLDQLENAKMVSEGSQYGVQYYNEAKTEEENLDSIH
ncbi:hypothetical protein ACLIBH_03705 [Virgibacillus sp. W0430]|uniref:hypothetical protein n=1 Tax=Virgibacillus sp. W0430 TaxID=3391580 RepID=UPI003F45998A